MVRPIPPDISYGLQCSVETFDLTEDAMSFFYRFNEDADLAELSDNYHHHDDSMDVSSRLRRFALDVYYGPYNEWFHTKANQKQRAWCVATAHQSYGRLAAEAVDYLVSKFISDALANDIDPGKTRFQREWLSRDRASLHGARISAQLGHKARMCLSDDVLLAITEPAEFNLLLPDQPRKVITLDQVTPTSVLRDRRKQQRKMLKRSSNFLSKLMGETETRMFIGGRAIKVEGQRFTFEVTKKRLVSFDHGALHISVRERHTGDFLCKLCWYVEATPAMDQVAALIMAVHTGDEDEIIRVGNALGIHHENLARYENLHDVLPQRNASDMFTDFEFDEDVQLSMTSGTHEYWRSNPDVYFSFSEQCRRMWMRDHFPEEIAPHYMVHGPETIRPYLITRFGCDLIPRPHTEAPALLPDVGMIPEEHISS